MRAAAVDDAAEMQWALDVITLSNARRWGNDELFEAKISSCIEKIKQLPLTLTIVKNQKSVILQAVQPTFWNDASEAELDRLIHDLGPLMRYRDPSRVPFRTLDFTDDVRIRTWLEIDGKPIVKSKFRKSVEEYITGLVESNVLVRKIKDGKALSPSEINEIVFLFEGFEHPISVENLREAWGAKRVKLEEFLAHILRGEELPSWEEGVRSKFEQFVRSNTTLNARQIEMLNALCTFVIANESITKIDLVEAPFTNFHRSGFLGVFEPNQIDEIMGLAQSVCL